MERYRRFGETKVPGSEIRVIRVASRYDGVLYRKADENKFLWDFGLQGTCLYCKDHYPKYDVHGNLLRGLRSTSFCGDFCEAAWKR